MRVANAFVVCELTSLFQRGHLVRSRFEFCQKVAAGSVSDGAVAAALVVVGIGLGLRILRTKCVDAVLRTVGDQHVFASQRPVMLYGQVGNKFQYSRRRHTHAFRVPAPWLHL